MTQITTLRGGVREGGELTIGSSDIPVLAGLVPKTPYELWRELTGRAPRWGGNAATELGHDLEPVILQRYIREHGDRETAYTFYRDYIDHLTERSEDYTPPTRYRSFTRCRHPDYPWASAHADLLDTAEPRIIEAKSGHRYARLGGRSGFHPEALGMEGIPASVLLQVQWQMLVYGVQAATVALLVDHEYYEFQAESRPAWQAKLLALASRMVRHVQEETPPPPQSYTDVKGLFPHLAERSVYLTGEEAEVARTMVATRAKHRQRIKLLREENKDIESALALLLKDARYLYDGETTERLCTQVCYETESMASPRAIRSYSSQVYEELREAGVIASQERRYIR